MEPEEIAKQLESSISCGRLREVRDILEFVNNESELNDIINNFSERDPVVSAVDKEQEDIAVYLIEKGFSFSNLYTHPNIVCNQWCHNNHHGNKCPSEYDALDLAKEKSLVKVAALILDIQQGLRQPGEGLTQTRHRECPRKSPTKSNNKIEKAVPSPELTPSHTRVMTARHRLHKVGSGYITRTGDTLLHESVAREDRAAMVHVCAGAGLNMNAQNFSGDTALHIAVRKRHLEAMKALLMNGSDLAHRNKLGQTPLDEAEGVGRQLLESYKCGLVAALNRGEKNAMQRIIRLWPNPDAVIVPGKTALELAEANKHTGKGHQACYNLLKDSLHTLRLVHAVLSEDLNKLKTILRSDGSYSINIQYKDRRGETPLTCAIDQHSLEIVQLLMETGKCHTNVRVRENIWTESTVPLYFKTLEYECPVDIWQYIVNNTEAMSYADRDCHGNTSILRAIVNGRSAEFIKQLLMTSNGHDIPYRNGEGLHARDLAKILGKEDIVKAIDQFICDNPCYLLMRLPVAFYGEENVQIADKNNRSLLDCAVAKGTQQDILAIRQYRDIEDRGHQLFRAAISGDVVRAAKLNTANFQDTKGYTALTYAVVFNQARVADNLVTQRPALCALPDNHGRVPLHFAYALPEDVGEVYTRLLLQREGDTMEHTRDKDGREPAEYQKLRTTPEISQMLEAVLQQDPTRQREDSVLAPSNGT